MIVTERFRSRKAERPVLDEAYCYNLVRQMLTDGGKIVVKQGDSIGWSRFVQQYVAKHPAWQTQLIEACVSTIADVDAKDETRQSAERVLQYGPLDTERRQHAIQSLATAYVENHKRARRGSKGGSTDGFGASLDALMDTFYTVGGNNVQEHAEQDLPFCASSLHDRYAKAKSKDEKAALVQLGTLHTSDGSAIRVLRPEIARDRSAVVKHAGSTAVAIAVSASVLSSGAAHADTYKREAQASGGSGASQSVSRTINTVSPPVVKSEVRPQLEVRSADVAAKPVPTISAEEIIKPKADLSAQVNALVHSGLNRTNDIKPTEVSKQIVNEDVVISEPVVAAQHDELPLGLSERQQIERRMFEQGLPSAPDASDDSANKSEVTTIREKLGPEMIELKERLRLTAEQNRVSPSTSDTAARYMQYLESAVENPAVLDLLSESERRNILRSSRLATSEHINAFLDNEPADSPMLEWTESLHEKNNALSDGVVTRMLYAGLYTSTLTKTEADTLLGYQPIEASDVIDTSIKQVEVVDASEIDLQAARNLSARGDNPEPNTTDWVNRGKVMEFFIERGFTPIQAAGAIGNFVIESGDDSLPPGIEQIGGGPGRGIVQWELSTNGGSGRADQLMRFAEEIGQPWDNLDTQLQFIMWEFDNTEQEGYEKLKAATTLEEAADAILNFYERPAVRDVTPRLAWAEATYEGYMEEHSKLSEMPEVVTSNEDRIDGLKRQGYTQDTINPFTGIRELVPTTISNFDYMNQNAIGLKQELEARGHDPEMGSDHLCGLVSIFMVKHTVDGKPLTEDQMGAVYKEMVDYYEWALAHEVFFEGAGGDMFHDKITPLAEHMGLQSIPLQKHTEKEIRLAFNNGATAIIMNSSGEKAKGKDDAVTQTGHLFVIRGITEDGLVLIGDPDSYERTQKTWTFEQLLKYSDLSSMHVLGGPGEIDGYQDIINERAEEAAREQAEKEEVERRAQEQAEREAQEKAEQEETERQRKAEEARQSGDWDPKSMPDGWQLSKELEAKYPVSGTLPMSELVVPVPGLFETMGDKGEVMLTPDAAEAFAAMNAQYKAEFGANLPVNDSYRSYESQVATKAHWEAEGDPGKAAEPGESPHGYRGVDINTQWRGSDLYNWLIANGPKYGYYNPVWMHPHSNNRSGYETMDEDWHFEYFGNAANLNIIVGGHPDYNMENIYAMLGR